MLGTSYRPIRCFCRCHVVYGADRTLFTFVDALDVLEAAVACPHCRQRHCVALLNDRLPNDPEPVERIHDPSQWVDPPSGGMVADSGDPEC